MAKQIDHPDKRPVLKLQPGRHKRVGLGHPWIYSNEIDPDSADLKSITPGSLVTVQTNFGEPIGVCYYHPNSLIAARMIDRQANTNVNLEFISGRLKRALDLREKIFKEPFYRLVHAEADGLPGVVVDRMGDVAVLQLNTQGAVTLQPLLVEALKKVIKPKTIVARIGADPSGREGLEPSVEVLGDALPAELIIRENDAQFYVDVVEGQKTGWFFDQRQNRVFMNRLAEGNTVLDLYAFGAGFGIQLAMNGAKEVVAVDRSKASLELAQKSAALNKVDGVCAFEEAEVFKYLESNANKKYDIVIADPPAFIKTKKDMAAGSKGYRKLTRLAADVVKPGGFLFSASCSHHVDTALYWEQVRMGLAKAGRTGRIIRQAGAGPDHPIHPFLPESAYLTALVIQLD